MIWNTAHSHVCNLVAYEPGKPVEDLAREMGIPREKIIKLASNENPLGPSPKAVEAMQRELARANFYPDGGGHYLCEKLAARLGLKRENIILGNGSNEVIEFVGSAFLKPGDEIVTSQHAFAVYRLIAQLMGASTVTAPERDFTHDLEAMMAAITPRTRVVFIANPNNPTGTMVGQDAIEAYLERVTEHVLTVFDEAYYEFLDRPPQLMRYVHEGRNVLFMRTFSKIQGLAGLRIGYGFGPSELIKVLQKTRQPFNTTSVAQAGALAGLDDDEYVARTRRMTREGRRFLEDSFERLGLRFLPSVANFVLVQVGDGDAVFQALLREGIIVRAMRSYNLPDWIRVSVGTMEQLEAFVSALEDVLTRRVSLDPAPVA